MNGPANLAVRVADRLRGLTVPWDVFAERSRRFEIHLQRGRVELTRGPLLLEGYGVRLLTPSEGQTGVGYRAATDFSEEGVRTAVAAAERLAHFNQFPARHPELPGAPPASPGDLKILDPDLWSDPAGTLEAFGAALGAAFADRPGAVPSFASVKATLVETSIANSTGLEYAYAHTVVETEVAVKAFGGPEGPAPGEYWYTDAARRLETAPLPALATAWSRFAEDTRRAKPPPNGAIPVVLPPEVLGGIIPPVVRFQFSAAARLRDLSVNAGTTVGPESLELGDDGRFDWGIGSAPVDDEGTPQVRHSLVSNGRVGELFFDVLHADALGARSTGNAARSTGFDPTGGAGRKFTRRPGPDATTLVVPAGRGGSDAELLEQVGDGLWVQQIGWASPDMLSGRFGGEIRLGYRIRHGKLAEPVRGGTVGGTVIARDGSSSLLKDAAVVGSEPRLVGAISTPTLAIGSLSVSGDDDRSSVPRP